jgi:hypothetical protein
VLESLKHRCRVSHTEPDAEIHWTKLILSRMLNIYVYIYIDIVSDEEHLIELRRALEHESVLKFTHEIGQNHKLPFQDILVRIENNSFVTNVYRKPTDVEKVLNEESECPLRCETSAVRSLIQRAFKTCTSQSDLKTELKSCKQILVNNGF